jgi:hypothetical protein
LGTDSLKMKVKYNNDKFNDDVGFKNLKSCPSLDLFEHFVRIFIHDINFPQAHDLYDGDIYSFIIAFDKNLNLMKYFDLLIGEDNIMHYNWHYVHSRAMLTTFILTESRNGIYFYKKMLCKYDWKNIPSLYYRKIQTKEQYLSTFKYCLYLDQCDYKSRIFSYENNINSITENDGGIEKTVGKNNFLEKRGLLSLKKISLI